VGCGVLGDQRDWVVGQVRVAGREFFRKFLWEQFPEKFLK
jgi:hypothetical protein